MTSTATAGVASADRRYAGRASALLAWADRNALWITALAAIAVFSMAKLPLHISQDSWLALISGRYIAVHGIPQHDTLFVVTHGARWLDQQWLAQLAIYGLYKLGGMQLYGLLYVALAISGLAICLAASRAFGGSERHMLWVLPIAGGLYFAGSFNVRTQGFALPLFAIVLWLLAREARGAHDRRVYLVLPLLILWGNLHGSVTLGVGLAVICGAVLIGQSLTDGRWRTPLSHFSRRGLVLLVGAPICLLLTPYGLSIITYYHETILNPQFSKVISEWSPITAATVLAVPFFILAGASVWLMGRAGRKMPIFDQLSLLALGVGTVFAVRNIPWYGMAAMMLLPGAVSGLFGPGGSSSRKTRVNLALVGTVSFVLLVTIVAVAARPSSWFVRYYDARAEARIAQIARQDPSARFYADNRFADWLLWEDPALADRIAYDIRFELLNSTQLNRVVTVADLPEPGQRPLLDDYRVLLLDAGNGDANKRILGRPGTRVLIHNSTDILATWTPSR
jgi:hypothetical protein